jgi:hypothetical protein
MISKHRHELLNYRTGAPAESPGTPRQTRIRPARASADAALKVIAGTGAFPQGAGQQGAAQAAGAVGHAAVQRLRPRLLACDEPAVEGRHGRRVVGAEACPVQQLRENQQPMKSTAQPIIMKRSTARAKQASRMRRMETRSEIRGISRNTTISATTPRVHSTRPAPCRSPAPPDGSSKKRRGRRAPRSSTSRRQAGTPPCAGAARRRSDRQPGPHAPSLRSASAR